ncbi:cholesterol esterase [Teratosphaeriaceae sp. CCFEE 6253]|nr:cholesterol esterase [Teratosphaeriaceae sp. CCFEE 6253]
MVSIPFIGRLKLTEYLALSLSFTLLFLETVVRSITLLLPGPVIRFCYRISRALFNALSSPLSRKARNRKKSVSSPIARASDFSELCALFGYYAEEHVVQTGDGYLLGLHRLGWKKGEEDQAVNAGAGSVSKKVVYLHHGLLMNSEVWVCLTEAERCLPFVLVEQGYDVWLGNNRGNKYSKKSLHHAPTEPTFWNFSMDQFAFHDIPDSINYVLSTTSQASLSYIGFSQGTAQAFATLSIHPTLNSKVNVFVALAPAMAPPGLASGIVASLCKSNPSILFLAFGRRAILGSATMWQALLYPGIFAWFIEKCLLFLFNWRTLNISPHQKLAAYPHLYSFTSTKSVVHWFQIIRHGTFQMYDDEVTTPLAVGNGSQYYKVAKFPTRNIKTPIVLVYGGSDSLVDINLMLKELPRHTIAKEVSKYEHLDLLWASDVHELVFPHVLEALETFATGPEKARTRAIEGWRGVNRGIHQRAALGSAPSPSDSLPPGYSEDERRARGVHERPNAMEGEHMDESDDEESAGPERLALTPASMAPARYSNVHRHQQRHSLSSIPLSPFQGTMARPLRSSSIASERTVMQSPTRNGAETPQSPRPNKRRVISPPAQLRQQSNRNSMLSDESSTVIASPTSNATDGASRHPRPEGWWSSTSTSGDEDTRHIVQRQFDQSVGNGGTEATSTATTTVRLDGKKRAREGEDG